MLASRSTVEATVLRTPGMLYQEQKEDRISNLYNIRLVNKTSDDLPVVLKMESGEGEIKMVGRSTIEVNSDSIASSEFFILLKRTQIKSRKTNLKIGVYSNGKKIKTLETSFLGPVSVNK
jgi:hypothetical protein